MTTNISTLTARGTADVCAAWTAVRAEYEAASDAFIDAADAADGLADTSPESIACAAAYTRLDSAISKVMATPVPLGDDAALLFKMRLFFEHTRESYDDELMQREVLEDHGPAFIRRDMDRLYGGPYHWEDEASNKAAKGWKTPIWGALRKLWGRSEAA